MATQTSRLELDVPGPDGRGWRNTGVSVDVGGESTLDEQWQHAIASGVQHLQVETYVSMSEPHYDAKVWPHLHPYGTGSLLSEPGSGSPQNHARNRLLLVQSSFRRSALWGFWFHNRLIVNQLYFGNLARQRAGRSGASTGQEQDAVTRVFGTAKTTSVPESSDWWKKQQKDLFAISDDAELGLMQAMVTVTHNDSCPEMLATIRRGPFAQPTDEEFIEYLLQRKPRDCARPVFEEFSVEHVLSFQRRMFHMKKKFMVRGKQTPLGVAEDWWDRTEEQMRAALHAHTLVWFESRAAEIDVGWKKLDAIERASAHSVGLRQRPRDQTVAPLEGPMYQEDNMYHKAKVARVVAEMARPFVRGARWGGYGYEHLRIAKLARAIQTRLYLHNCSTKYCLQNRSTCRFFFPWPHMPQQQYDLNMERVALQRRCPCQLRRSVNECRRARWYVQVL